MPHNSPLVVVVLSTFNGEQYLREQITSLLNQTHTNVQIIVRDDGSQDRTREILADFSHKFERVNVSYERNIGVVGSFLRLLELVPEDVNYVALCDQDDVWRGDKIERALSMLGEVDGATPAMYCGAVEVVDENLNTF